MAKLQVLSPGVHKQTGILTDYVPQLGYGQGAVMVLPNEILHVQREYPILFRKHPETGRLFLNALLGFEEQENLYLDGQGGWQAGYVPLAFAKGPFMVGFQSDGEGQKAVLSIDMDDPRVTSEGGEKLFTAEDKPSEYLNNINNILATMHEGLQVLDSMLDAFNEYELIEPVSLNIELKNGEKINFTGAYTVAQEKIQKLDKEALAKLNQSGFLSAAIYISGSLSNVAKLINFKNARI